MLFVGRGMRAVVRFERALKLEEIGATSMQRHMPPEG